MPFSWLMKFAEPQRVKAGFEDYLIRVLSLVYFGNYAFCVIVSDSFSVFNLSLR